MTITARGLCHDYRHLDAAGWRAMLAAKPSPWVREAAGQLGIRTARRPIARLIEDIVAQRTGWPPPTIGLTTR